MLRQYRPQRQRAEVLRDGRTRMVGTLPIGTIFRMPTRYANGGRAKLRKFIVDAWLPRRIGAARTVIVGDRRTYEDGFSAAGGHIAIVRCLSDGKRTWMADHHIRRWVDLEVAHVMPPTVPAAISERKRHRFLTLRTAEGTFFDLDRAA